MKNEGDHVQLLSNRNHNEPSISSDNVEALSSSKCNTNLDHKPMSKDANGYMNLDATHLNVVDNFSSVVNIEIPITMKNSEDGIRHAAAEVSLTESHASDSDNHVIITDLCQTDFSTLEDETNKAQNINQGDHNHQRKSRLKNTENTIPKNASKERKIKRSISLTSMGISTYNGVPEYWNFLSHWIPFALYYLTQTTDSETDADYSHEINISNVSVDLI